MIDAHTTTQQSNLTHAKKECEIKASNLVKNGDDGTDGMNGANFTSNF